MSTSSACGRRSSPTRGPRSTCCPCGALATSSKADAARYADHMQVADVMSRASVVESPSDSLRAAATLMWKQQTGSLLVMDGDELLGIVTERDVMKAVARGGDPDATPVSAVMTTDLLTVTRGTSPAATPVSAVMTTTLLTVSPDTSVPAAARHRATRWIRHLPVVADGKLLGMVSQRDLCGVLAALGSEADLLEIPADELVRSRRAARLQPQSP